MPNPTPQEEFLLQYCNYPVQQGGYDGFGFFWDEFTKISPDYWTRQILLDDWLNQSYYAYTNTYGFVAIQYFETGRLANQTNHEIWVAQGILRADITTVDSTHYRVNVNNITYTPNVYHEYITTNPSQEAYANSFSIGIKNNAPFYSGYMRDYTPPTSFEYTAPSRESALQELVTVFHNIKIWVDGEKWTDARPITYNWQSVPSISGKNGILLMPTLSDTNNGNPVSGASSSVFIKAPSSANNIRNLVDLSLEPTNTDDAATIFYTIPDGTYTSIKLYGKIGENPKCNSTDDIIEDINQNDTSISVENLECEEYYFCIQAITTDLTLSSNVVSIDLSFNWDGSEITILWSGDNNRMTAELIESNGNKHIKFRMYLSDTLIYQFIGQYVDESLSRTVKDINIGFLIDEDNQIGRPSNIYYVSDENDTNYQKYIYNASDETPSDSEMEDIYTWLIVGMN